MLDLSSFKKAFESLKTIIERYNKDTSDDGIRDSVIQRFEYTYGLAIKIIERFLEMTAAIDVDKFTFNELIRTANEKEILLGELEDWLRYREKRNITSHTYNEEKALEVISIMDDFVKEIEFLIKELESRNAG